MVGNCKDIRFEGGIGLEGRAVDGNVNIGCGAEYPFVAGMVVLVGSSMIVSCWETLSTAARLTLLFAVDLERMGDIGTWLSRRDCKVTPWIAE